MTSPHESERNIPAVRSVMTDAEYDREKARLVEMYGEADGKSVGVIARRDQAFARFWFRSGWPQDRIAAKEGKSPQWVSQRLRFGRFLAFSADSTTVEFVQNLTERRFRGYWEQTDKTEGNDNIRFRAVLKLMEGDLSYHRSRAPKGIGDKIMEEFADGQWHRFETILEHLKCPEEDLQTTLKWMEQRGTFKSKVESKPYGKGKAYRIMRQDRMVSVHELTTKFDPLIAALIEEGKKHSARISPAAVLRLAGKMQELLREWSDA